MNLPDVPVFCLMQELLKIIYTDGELMGLLDIEYNPGDKLKSSLCKYKFKLR